MPRALAIGPLLSCSSVARRRCSLSSCRTQSMSDEVSTFGARDLLVWSDQVREKEQPFHHEGSADFHPDRTALRGSRGWGGALPSATSETNNFGAAPLTAHLYRTSQVTGMVDYHANCAGDRLTR